MILGHGGMAPRGVVCRTGLYWDVLGCPSTLALRCSKKSLAQTGVYCYTLE